MATPEERLLAMQQDMTETAATPGAARDNPFATYREQQMVRPNPFAPRQDFVEEPFPTAFPMVPGTSRASLQLPELAEAGLQEVLPEDIGLFEGAGLTSAMLTTTDPQEIADILTQSVEVNDPVTGQSKVTRRFPNIGIATAPDGTLIVGDNSTGKRFIINRPGLSLMDVMQGLGIASVYAPAGGVAGLATRGARTTAARAATDTQRKLALKEARKKGALSMAGASAVTETGIQAGQEMAGGDFDPLDVGASAAFGAVPEFVGEPVVRFGTKIPSMVKEKTTEVVPKNLQQAMHYAKETGRKIMTSDLLQERMTPSLNILTRMAERIPIMGTGAARRKIARQRVDALTELAAAYDIDVTSDYGTEVMENFVERMKKRRFWGANEKLMRGSATRAKEMIKRAFEKEIDELSEGALTNAIKKGSINDEVVDKVMDAGRTNQLDELFNKLMPEGKTSAKRRFLVRGLEKSNWSPDSPSIADPKLFMSWLDKPEHKRVLRSWFDPGEEEMIEGLREYLRLTVQAQESGKGAGMTAAMAAGAGGGMLLGFMSAVAGMGAAMGAGARTLQGPMRNFFVKLAHTKGDEMATAALMEQARPLMVAAQNVYKGENWEMPDIEITEESLKEGGEDAMRALRERSQSILGTLTAIPDWVVRGIKGGQ